MQIDLGKQDIPWLMAAARALLGPIIVLVQTCHWSGLTLASLIVAALLSDIFDGVLARRWHCDTPAVRLGDSMADTVFFLGVAVALWLRYPQLWRAHWALLAGLLALEALRFVFDIAKFGKPASYHSYLAKTWGLVLAVAVVVEFAASHASPLIGAALLLGIVCNLEGFAMSLVLPDWSNDVKTLRAAWHLRKRMLAHRYPRTSSNVVAIPTASSKPHKLMPHATYINGTLPHIAPDSVGTLDASSPTQINFKAGTCNLPITYEKNQSV
jgi:phosphatidylglycerophosphate synthase